MKALLIVLLPVLCLKGNLSTVSVFEPVKPILCYECLQSGSFKCDKTKSCNSTAGLCQMVIYEGKDGEKSIRQSCATDCELPTSLFIHAKNYHALCCSFHFCNQFQYSWEVAEHQHQPNSAVSGFTPCLFWVILQYIGLEN